ncbi:hypothetical protein EUZ85_19480 [Hahella sp. KA22]|uniref:hypothetical protein n=1 Tax=Hahella sp. KA22 TaxID=1628392 RepID=UPI000FDED30A|nr:hypothetical protein [Hahella sp. KA22]AZZ92786.1 hypothetical protein ENC22_16900 [Hahella sp. KA22]QAY56160.1 hypothetical protein EUZ85_19480 [Hahella sp. KA22]
MSNDNTMLVEKLKRDLIRSTRANDRLKKELDRAQRALSAFEQGQQQLNLTIQQVGELAQHSGYNVNYSDIDKNEREQLVCVADGPRGGLNDDDGKPIHFSHIMWFEEIPEEGCIGLGEELPDPPPARLLKPIQLKRKLFQFDNSGEWMDRSQALYAECSTQAHNIIALDACGVVCRTWAQVSGAKESNSFPITVYELEG